ncbi:MAG TPA: 50S ribosomal protein L25 [Thermoanaerobaculia bacterium]|nr:50S ribosomal protein L25 [Thermoanaerobaculia bacterium]
MKTIELNVQRRDTAGKNEARRSRAQGQIPAVVYGAGKPTVPISVDRTALMDAFRHGAGDNAIFLLKLAGSDQSRHAMIKEMQRDPASRKPLHIDFVRVMMDTKIRVKVSLETVGVPKGVKTEGGILDFVTREVMIECLPGNIPAHVPIDVAELSIGDALRVSQVPALEGVTILEDADRVLVHVTHPTAEKAPEVAAAEAAAEITEPEVLKKGKVETEEPVEEKGKEKEKDKDKEKEKKEK